METNNQNRRQPNPREQTQPNELDVVVDDFVQQLSDEIMNTLAFRRIPMNENPYGNTTRQQSNNNDYTRTTLEDEYSSIIYTIRNSMDAYSENFRIFLELMNNIQNNIAEHLRNNLSSRQTSRRYQRRQFRTETTHTNISQQPHSMSYERHPNQSIYTRQHYPLNTSRIPLAPQEQRANRVNPLIHILQNIFTTTENLQDVVVRPSPEQIENATRRIVYSADTPNIYPNCPITLENFEDGQLICQIIHCGHCFTEESMESWFRGHVRCPVCRYDIRDYSLLNQDISANETRTIENVAPLTNMRDIINSFQWGFANITQNANMLDISGNRTYTYELPIIYYRDISYNFDYPDESTLESVD
jgi:hypothetical protein